MARYFLGLTGASGHAYALRLIDALLGLGHGVDLSLTSAGSKVLLHETGIAARGDTLRATLLERMDHDVSEGQLRVFGEKQVEAPASSGTAGTAAVVLVPCSMGTLARVAAGFSSNLPERAADVALKEGRRLVLVPRETPLSAIHLENMLKLVRMGAVCLPAAPGFYHHPRAVEDLVDHVVGKVLDRLGIGEDWRRSVRWSGDLEPPPEAGTS